MRSGDLGRLTPRSPPASIRARLGGSACAGVCVTGRVAAGSAAGSRAGLVRRTLAFAADGGAPLRTSLGRSLATVGAGIAAGGGRLGAGCTRVALTIIGSSGLV